MDAAKKMLERSQSVNARIMASPQIERMAAEARRAHSTPIDIAIGAARELGREETTAGWNARCYELQQTIAGIVGNDWPEPVKTARKEGAAG